MANPLDQLVSPVTVDELSDWLGGGLTEDPLLAPILLSATSAAISFMQLDILPRQWKHVIYPVTPQKVGLSGTFQFKSIYELPYSALLAVNSVLDEDGELDADEYEVDMDANPGRIIFLKNTEKATVFYTAGMTEPDLYITEQIAQIPQAIKNAIKSIAAYIYENRGCSMEDVIGKSGAGWMLQPFKIEGGI